MNLFNLIIIQNIYIYKKIKKKKKLFHQHKYKILLE